MNSSRKYLFVVNPISGDLDKSDMIQSVQAAAKDRNIEIHVFETDGKNDETQIRDWYDANKPERVLVAGGDGTIKMVAETLEDCDVIFGLIPAGSANGLSVDLEFPTDFEAVIDIAFDGKPKAIDMVCINNIKSIHLSDLGLNASLVKNYEQSSIRGKIGYALQSINTLKEEGEPFNVRIEANGGIIESEARMVVVANSQKYGTGVVINPMGKLDDGKFEIVLLKTLDLILFGKIITGNMPLDTGEIEIISTDKATITTNVPIHFQVDGEYCGEESKLDVYMLPGQMKIAHPLPAE
ncbi:diacylglycerol/lipid kinase family protein [Flavobacterium silvaticum]|uniref:Diacylglycerol kinase n=1 Tax=Flavobacterium silvaticum TaxID=1852020 RepID=A0A972JHX1_9FLAO|nr:diacylglycerol kinase family protein [Flavobacterium silvaticum]NMH27583.1 diacylglycerol kinase [Flavobacterium silvaticum]